MFHRFRQHSAQCRGSLHPHGARSPAAASCRPPVRPHHCAAVRFILLIRCGRRAQQQWCASRGGNRAKQRDRAHFWRIIVFSAGSRALARFNLPVASPRFVCGNRLVSRVSGVLTTGLGAWRSCLVRRAQVTRATTGVSPLFLSAAAGRAADGWQPARGRTHHVVVVGDTRSELGPGFVEPQALKIVSVSLQLDYGVVIQETARVTNFASCTRLVTRAIPVLPRKKGMLQQRKRG